MSRSRQLQFQSNTVLTKKKCSLNKYIIIATENFVYKKKNGPC